MQVGRVVLVMTEDESNNLLKLLESDLYVNFKDQCLVKDYTDKLKNANRTVFIDDYRPDKIGSLPE